MGCGALQGCRVAPCSLHCAAFVLQAYARSRHKSENLEGRKRVLVLGAGMVSAPLVEYLHRDPKIHIKVCSQVKEEADRLAHRYAGVESSYINVQENPEHLRELCESADCVVSLLPYDLHGIVARHCIDGGTHFLTASYVTKAVQELHEDAERAGVTLFNEIGLDPGIDHLLAMECIDDVKEKGGIIESFISYCGGLPAPEHSDNPLRYKFSWSPRGAIINTLSSAKYLNKGQVVEIQGGGDLMSAPKDLNFLPGFALEGFPNRDSLQYNQLYGLGPHVHTLLRGTIRFKGFSDCIRTLQLMGLIDPEPHAILHPRGPEITWRQLIVNFLGLADSDIFYDNLKQVIFDRDGNPDYLEALGLLDDTPVQKLNTPLDTVCAHLSKRLAIGPDERDLVILRHEVGICWNDGRREERGINFVAYGQPASKEGGHSAMARTVGFPAAIATKMILDGEIQKTGIVLPFSPDIYRPLLNRLRVEGLTATETSRFL